MSGINNKIWTDEEIKILNEHYSINGALYCEKILNRSITAIRRKANILKLGKTTYKGKYTKNELSITIANSISISDVLIKLNLRCAGGNFKTIKKYIELYNIDTSHFETRLDIILRMVKSTQIKDIDKMFCENSTTSRGTIKKYIFKEGFKENICCLCGQDENWYGKKITLILDHINGIHNDNRLENLQIVCPNCNATLDTHCGKNIKHDTKPIKINSRELNKQLYDEKQLQYIDIILNSNIVFDKIGWVQNVAEIINKKTQKVNIWMKRYMLEFYNEKCFKRNSITKINKL